MSDLLARAAPAPGHPHRFAPIANTQIHALDAQASSPCPIGVPGEIFIGGDGVAIGYLKREELTAERFHRGPGSAGRAHLPHRRPRALAQRRHARAHGAARFQVKVRGYRIELGEIEANLARHPGRPVRIIIVREDRRRSAHRGHAVVPRGEGVKARDAMSSRGRRPTTWCRIISSSWARFPAAQRQGRPQAAAASLRDGGAARLLAPAPTWSRWWCTMQQVPAAQRRRRRELLRLRPFAPGGATRRTPRAKWRASRRCAHPHASDRRTAGAALNTARSIRRAPSGRRCAGWWGQSEAPLTLMQESMRFAEELYPGGFCGTTRRRRIGSPERSICRPSARLSARWSIAGCVAHADRSPRRRDSAGGAAASRRRAGARRPAAWPPKRARRTDAAPAAGSTTIAIASAPLFRVGLSIARARPSTFFFRRTTSSGDGWSFRSDVRGDVRAYAAEVEKRESRLAAVAPLVDFSVWFGERLASEDCADQLGYWK